MALGILCGQQTEVHFVNVIQSPFCLNVPYILGLGKQFCIAGRCTETSDNVEKSRLEAGLGFLYCYSLARVLDLVISWLVAALASAGLRAQLRAWEQAQGHVAHRLWVLQCAINKRNPQNPQTI